MIRSFEGLDSVAEIVKGQVEQGRDVVVNVNNHYEGCAVMTIGRLVERAVWPHLPTMQPNRSSFWPLHVFIQQMNGSLPDVCSLGGALEEVPKHYIWLKIFIFYFRPNKPSQNHNSHTNNYPSHSAH